MLYAVDESHDKNCYMNPFDSRPVPVASKAGFGYDNSVSLQTDDAGHVGAAVLAHVASVVG